MLLATLLLHANKPVSIDALADAVWNGAPPAGAATTLRGHVLRLRRILGPDAGARVVVRDPGYLVRVADSELDVLEFQELSRSAGAAIHAGAWAKAATAASRALAQWQGTPLVDVPCQALHDAWVPRLEQVRVQSLEWRIDADLHLGRRDQLVPELRALVADHPLRERFHTQLVLALAGSGRRAEALTAYQDARRVLIGELGIEPGPELRDLQERVLAGDAGLLNPPRPAGESTPSRAAVVPRQLPPTTRHFVGRETELEVLAELLSRQAEANGTVVISAIGGTAGIGKTTLAVHWAHQAAARFPDGQLYVNLRGFDPSREPMPPLDAIRRFLDALGVPPGRIPVDPEDQAAFYRSHLADRRMLILLDNARDDEQVRPLLPGTPGVLVLVTSRNRLGGLVAVDGAIPLTLDLLTEPEARDLLIRRLGSERVLADERTAAALIDLCARLPLALNIAVAHAVLHPARPLSELVDELRDARRRLDTLALEDTAADLRAVFSWSYRALSPAAARVFRLLGLHEGPDISLQAAASLAALDLDAAGHALDELVRAHLLTEHAPGRFSFHDLLRAYAADQAHTRESETAREQALRRVCDFYLHTTHAADRLMAPERPSVELAPPAPGTQPYLLPDVSTAVAWLDAEHPNVLAAQRTAAAYGWHAVVWQLAWTLTTYYRNQGRAQDQVTVWQAAADCIEHLPDSTSRIRAFLHLGRSHAESGHHDEAIKNLNQAVALADLHGTPADRTHTQFAFTRAWELHGDDRQALHHARIALDLCRTLGEPVWEADALNAVGWHAAQIGEYDTARAHCESALALLHHDDNPDSRGQCLKTLGYIEHHAGRHRLAVDHYHQALNLFRDIGNTYDCAIILEELGHPHAALGQHDQARTVWRQAVELYRHQNHPEAADRVQRQLDAIDA